MKIFSMNHVINFKRELLKKVCSICQKDKYNGIFYMQTLLQEDFYLTAKNGLSFFVSWKLDLN